MYTNKVIETFNAGILKLDDHERGITLRAYLANKLSCDPMRITKKYTGASCLGKKVFHASNFNANSAEVDRARLELDMLERNFRTKLEQMNRKKVSGHQLSDIQRGIVSTPAIDALLSGQNAQRPWGRGEDISRYNIPMYPHVVPVLQHIKDPEYIKHLQTQGWPPKDLQFMQNAMRRDSISNSGEGYATSTDSNSEEQDRTNNKRSFSSMQQNSSKKDPVPKIAAKQSPTIREVNSDYQVSYSNLDSSAASRGRSYSVETEHSAVSEKDDYRLHDISEIEEKVETAVQGDEENISKRIKISEADHNAAASSLLGFFNHIKANSSQQDLVEFFEGVQKTVANSRNTSSDKLSSKMDKKSSPHQSSSPLELERGITSRPSQTSLLDAY